MAQLLVHRVRIAIVMLALALSACNGDGPGPAQEISIALSPTTLTITQGQNGTVTVTVGRLNGFASAVTLSLEGAPAGVTGAFNPASVPNGTTASTLTITVGATAATGAHTLTVRGRGQDVTDKTATLTLTVTAAPTLALAINPTSLSVQQGQSGTSAVTITRGGSFTSAVDLTAEGAPTGVTVSFNPASLAAGVSASTMTVAVTASAATGASTITVRARGQGVPDQTVALTLTVTAVTPEPSYTLALTPTSAAVQQGASTAVQVSVTRSGGFSGSVTLSLESAPAGVTGTFSPNPATGNSSTLTIAVAAGTPLATHSLTVKGTAPGLTDRTATFSLQVTLSGGVGNVSFRFCASPLPIWVAYQDDTGPWTRATAGANNTYSFAISSRGGVAIVTPDGSGYTTEVIYATASELATIGSSWDFECEFAPGTKQLTGTVAGVGASEDATITLGPIAAFVPPGGTSYTLDNVPDGALDLVAVRGTSSGFLDFTTNKLIIRRGLNLPNGSTITALDFNAAEAFAPVSGNLTIGGLGADEPGFFVSYVTGAGTGVNLTSNFAAVGATHVYQGVPSSAQAAGDLHQFLVFAGSPSGTTSRGVLAAFHAAGDRTVTLGPDLTTPTVSVVASSPYVRYRMQLPMQSQYSAMANADFLQDAIARTTSIFATAGYFGGAPSSWDLTIPDLTAAAGFDPNWGLQSGNAAEWAATAYGGSIFAVPAEGTTLLFASRFSAAPLAAIANQRGFDTRSAQPALRALRSVRVPMQLRLPSRR
jgi:hypothetical protein